MNSELSDKLVGLVMAIFVMSIIGYAGVRSVREGLGGLKKRRNLRIYNYAGIVFGSILTVWVLICILLFLSLWLKNL